MAFQCHVCPTGAIVGRYDKGEVGGDPKHIHDSGTKTSSYSVDTGLAGGELHIVIVRIVITCSF